jgi:hypothetical protein
MNACDNIIALAQGLDVGRRLLYGWRDRSAETHGIVPRLYFYCAETLCN